MARFHFRGGLVKALGWTYPGVVVTLYLITDESPFSPPMSSVMGLGIIEGLVKVSADL